MNIEFNKVTWYSKLLAVVIFVSTFYIGYYLGQDAEKINSLNKKIETTTDNHSLIESENNTSSIHDGTYKIAGEKVTLKNGISEVETTPGSVSKVVTKYFGNDLKIDLNKDGREDLVFIVTQETGGSGIFYYVIALLNTPSGNVCSDGLLLGDRIAPQTIEKGKDNIIVVNYADRKSGESFSVPPSFGKSLWLLLDTKTMQFGEVAQNFEGETDASKI